MDSGRLAGPLLSTISLLPCCRCRCREMRRTGNQGCICLIILCKALEDHGHQVKVGYSIWLSLAQDWKLHSEQT